jgi:hypothetical protein
MSKVWIFWTNTCLLWVVSWVCVIAQPEKQTIGVYPFSHDAASAGKAVEYCNMVSDALNNTKRFILVNRSSWGVKDAELERQKGENFIRSDKVVEQGRKLGATYVIQGFVQSLTGDQGPYNQVMLQLVDVATEQEVDNVIITPNGSVFKGSPVQTTGWMSMVTQVNPEKAIEKGLREFISKNFPIEVPIVEIAETNKEGHAARVLVECGSSAGMKKNVKLYVMERSYRTTSSGVKEALDKQIAELTISEVQGESFSVCSVSKKQAPLLTQKINEKANLFVTDKNKNDD